LGYGPDGSTLQRSPPSFWASRSEIDSSPSWADADDPVISAATLVEASIVMQAKLGDDGVTDLDELLAAAAARCVAVDVAQAVLARDAAREGCRTAAPVQGIRLQPH
jgi:hypothetical protein